MAYSYTVTPDVDGAQTDFPVEMAYIAKSHIHAFVDEVEVTFTWLNDGMIKLDAAPTAGSTVKVQRITPTASRLVNFQDVSILTEAVLDQDSDQLLMVVQEAYDYMSTGMVKDFFGNFDCEAKRLVNAADPVDDQDLVTKVWAETGMSSELAAAITARTATETAQGLAEDARDASQTAQGLAEDAQAAAEAAEANAAATLVTLASNLASALADIASAGDAELVDIAAAGDAELADIAAEGDTQVARVEDTADSILGGGMIPRTTVITSQDWDTITEAGMYSVSNASGSNMPSGAYAWGILNVFNDGTQVAQTYIAHNSTPEIYTRVKSDGGVWRAWVREATTGDNIFTGSQKFYGTTQMRDTPLYWYKGTTLVGQIEPDSSATTMRIQGRGTAGIRMYDANNTLCLKVNSGVIEPTKTLINDGEIHWRTNYGSYGLSDGDCCGIFQPFKAGEALSPGFIWMDTDGLIYNTDSLAWNEPLRRVMGYFPGSCSANETVNVLVMGVIYRTVWTQASVARPAVIQYGEWYAKTPGAVGAASGLVWQDIGHFIAVDCLAFTAYGAQYQRP